MGRHRDEDTVRMQVPVDPWAGDTRQFSVAPAAGRRVYGRVYEVFTGDPQDGPHPYVGQTTQTIHQRVHGPRGHTSAESVAKDPWKARILPGRAGYRCLKTIYATGNEVEDQMRLDLAEAILIDELRTTHNDQRPIRPPGPAPAARPRRRVRVPARMLGFLLVWAALSVFAGRIAAAGHLPVMLGAAVVLIPAWFIFLRLHRIVTWLAGNPVPRQPTRPARRRRRR